jgi:alpha,alpha-trehalase
MIAKNASEYNGTVPEKYDVVIASHKVFAEYGNQGTDFEYITREGFGWMNASFQYGFQLLQPDLKEKLNHLTAPNELFEI